jgi:hypothetical protein
VISQGVRKGKVETETFNLNQKQKRLVEISILTTRLLDLYVGEDNMGEITLSRLRKPSNNGKSSSRVTEIDSVESSNKGIPKRKK